MSTRHSTIENHLTPLSFFSVLALSLCMLGCTSVETEIVIPASSEEIWSVLTDAEGNKEWNPVLIPLQGKIKDGAKIKYHYFQPDKEPIEIESKVVKFERYKELNKSGKDHYRNYLATCALIIAQKANNEMIIKLPDPPPEARSKAEKFPLFMFILLRAFRISGKNNKSRRLLFNIERKLKNL